MEPEKVQIRPLTPAVEESLIDYRLSHPDALAKQASRHFYLLDTSYLPSELQAAAASENAERAETLELDVTRYTLALRRARKAAEAQRQQQETYAAQTSALAVKCEERRQEIASERKQLEFVTRKKQMHEETNALAKQLNGRPKKRAELDQLIADIENQIKEQEMLIVAYQTESVARLEAFNEVSAVLDKVTGVERVETDRSPADLAGLDKIIGTSKINALTAAASSSSLASRSRAGSPLSAADSRKVLDPKASVFTPGGRPSMPNTTASSPVISGGHAATSRSAANSRKDKSGSAATSAGRTGTSGSSSLKANAASAGRTRSSNDVAAKKASTAAGRARSPLVGNTSKEPGAPRTGGRRQATNAPSQLGKSSVNMEDGEISRNTSEGADPPQGSAANGGKPAGAENGGGNKRKPDQEDGEAAKRRKVEESKQDGVTGV